MFFIPVVIISVFPLESMLVADINLNKSELNLENIFAIVSLSILLIRLLIKSSLISFLVVAVAANLVGVEVPCPAVDGAGRFGGTKLAPVMAEVEGKEGFMGTFAAGLFGDAACA